MKVRRADAFHFLRGSRLSLVTRHSSLARRAFTLRELRGRFAFTLPELRGRFAFTSAKQRERFAERTAFTLVELLVVIGIISILLVAVIPAVNSLSKSSGRKGAVSNLLGAIEQARAQAIKDGRATYVVFPTFTSGTQSSLDRYNYKSYAIFEDDPAAPTTPKQLTNWKTLPTRVALRSSGPARLSNLPDPADATMLTPAVTITFGPDVTAGPFRCFKFNANGEIESPPDPPGTVTIAIFEGYVNGGSEIITGSKDPSGNPLATESISIARLTGRAISTQ